MVSSVCIHNWDKMTLGIGVDATSAIVLRLVDMWPREVSHAKEILRRAGYSSHLVTSRPSSSPHLFSNMDSPTRRHLGLPSCPAGREELRRAPGRMSLGMLG